MHNETLYQAAYVYSDSTAFPRSTIVSPIETWPILLNEIASAIYLRGKGGVQSKALLHSLREDSFYFNLDSNSNYRSLVIFAFGIVDCAPRPITYKLKAISRIPIFGPRLWSLISTVLKPHRIWIQRISSYQVTPASRFQRNLEKMLNHIKNQNSLIVILGTPRPSSEAIRRSPGFEEAIDEYNEIKRKLASNFSRAIYLPIEIEDATSYISLEDGHHFSKKGHKCIADLIIKSCREFERGSISFDT